MKQSFKLNKEFIQLNQLLKVLGWAMTGGEANQLIDDGFVKVNGEVEFRRRNKLYKGFEIQYNNEVIVLE